MNLLRMGLFIVAPAALVTAGVLAAGAWAARRQAQRDDVAAAKTRIDLSTESVEALEVAALANAMADEGGVVTIEEVIPLADGGVVVTTETVFPLDAKS